MKPTPEQLDQYVHHGRAGLDDVADECDAILLKIVATWFDWDLSDEDEDWTTHLYEFLDVEAAPHEIYELAAAARAAIQ